MKSPLFNKPQVLKSFTLILIITFSFSFSQTDTNKAAQLQKQIESQVTNFLRANDEARKLFNEAIADASAKSGLIMSKLSNLAKKIEDFSKLENANQKGLNKAKELYEKAESEIKSYNYSAAEISISEAMENISLVPVVSLKIEPQIFSPDGDGYNDLLNVYSKVYSKTEISNWSLTIFQELEKGDEIIQIPVKTSSGVGHPAERMVWKGVLDDGENMVDSGSRYLVELTATDIKNGTGKSLKTPFRTDIFVINTKRGLLINISSITFDFNSAVLKDKYKPILSQLFKKLLEYPEYSIAVEGHTDSVGKASGNKKLSQMRADSVANKLIKLGISRERIKTYGLGEALPKTLDNSKIDLNRRVNFFLLKNKSSVSTYERFISKLNLNAEIKMNTPDK